MAWVTLKLKGVVLEHVMAGTTNTERTESSQITRWRSIQFMYSMSVNPPPIPSFTITNDSLPNTPVTPQSTSIATMMKYDIIRWKGRI